MIAVKPGEINTLEASLWELHGVESRILPLVCRFLIFQFSTTSWKLAHRRHTLTMAAWCRGPLEETCQQLAYMLLGQGLARHIPVLFIVGVSSWITQDFGSNFKREVKSLCCTWLWAAVLPLQNWGQRPVKWSRVSWIPGQNGQFREVASFTWWRYVCTVYLPDIVLTQTLYFVSVHRGTTRAIVTPSSLWGS